MAYERRERSKPVICSHDDEIVSVRDVKRQASYQTDENSLEYYDVDYVVLKKRCKSCGRTYTEEVEGTSRDYRRC